MKPNDTAQSVQQLGYGMDVRGTMVRLPAEARDSSLLQTVQTGSEAHPASYSIGTGALSLWIKRSGREADHSSPSAQVKNECS
jgi:hypothetical protein